MSEGFTRIDPRFLTIPEGADTRPALYFLRVYAMTLKQYREANAPSRLPPLVVGAVWAYLTILLINAVEAHNQDEAPSAEDQHVFGELYKLQAAMFGAAAASGPEILHAEVYRRIRDSYIVAGEDVGKLITECDPLAGTKKTRD